MIIRKSTDEWKVMFVQWNVNERQTSQKSDDDDDDVAEESLRASRGYRNSRRPSKVHWTHQVSVKFFANHWTDFHDAHEHEKAAEQYRETWKIARRVWSASADFPHIPQSTLTFQHNRRHFIIVGHVFSLSILSFTLFHTPKIDFECSANETFLLIISLSSRLFCFARDRNRVVKLFFTCFASLWLTWDFAYPLGNCTNYFVMSRITPAHFACSQLQLW